jgi:hypothetical protein
MSVTFALLDQIEQGTQGVFCLKGTDFAHGNSYLAFIWLNVEARKDPFYRQSLKTRVAIQPILGGDFQLRRPDGAMTGLN